MVKTLIIFPTACPSDVDPTFSNIGPTYHVGNGHKPL